jgi:photosystem II stability/assembly factor-like uncharacterized protein
MKGSVGIAGSSAFLALTVWFAASIQKPDDLTNLRSVKSITKQLQALKQNPQTEESEATDYLEALRERIYIKSFPNDSPNEDQYFRASEHARLMPPATAGKMRLAGGKIGGIITVGGEPKWEFVGPRALTVPYNIYYGPPGSNINGRIGGLAFDSKISSTMYMAAPAGGIWKTTDSGTTWTPIGDHFPSPYVSVIGVSPKYNNLVIAGLGDKDGGTGTGNGIMRSDDGGATWTNIVLRNGTSASKVLFDPENFSTVMVSMAGGGGLFRSTNQGYSFTNIPIGGNSFANITDMSVSLPDGSGSRRYAAQVRNAGLFLSSDGGLTWTLSNEPAGALNSARSHIDFSHMTSNRIYYINDGLKQIYQGDITGTVVTWTNITGNFPTGTSNYNWSQSSYDNYLRVAAHAVNGVKKDFVYVGLITVAAWDGTSWTDVGQTYTNSAVTHNDQHCFAVFPGDETKMVVGNDGGAWPLTYTAPAGANPQSWAFNITSSATLGISMFYTGAFHPTDPTKMMGGTQDNASPVSTGNLSAWVNRTGGDGMGCAVNPVNPLVWYGSAQNNGLYRTANGWSTQSSFGPSSWGTDTLPFVTRMAVDPTSPNPLYVATNYLWRYNPGTNVWDARLGSVNLCPAGGTVLSIDIAPSNANVLYAGTTNGDLWRSGDKGGTWTKLDDISSPVVPARSITRVNVSPTNPNDILITLSGSGTSHIWRIADTSITTPILTAVNGTGVGQLPDSPTNWVTRDDVSPSTTWYVATDVGVFMTTNGGAAWTNATEPLGLPICEVSRVEWIPGTGYLNAATYGRGMWRIRIKDTGTATDTTFSIKPTTVRFENEYTVKYRITNTGLATANAMKITSASLKMASGSTTLVTSLPLLVGQINPTGTAQPALLWTGPNKADSGGTVTISGSYIVGGVTRTFTLTNTVSFP